MTILSFLLFYNTVLDYGMTMESVDFSFTESISLDPSFTTFSMSDLPDMDSFSTSMSFTPTISFTDSFSLPDLDDSTSFIEPTSTSDFQMSSTALIGTRIYSFMFLFGSVGFVFAREVQRLQK